MQATSVPVTKHQPQTAHATRRPVLALVVLATAAVFIADLQTPWGATTWILYAFPMFLLCRETGERHLYLFAYAVSLLIVLDHFLSDPMASMWMSLANRGAALAVLWTSTLLLVRRERDGHELRRSHDRLEAVVAERTASLQAANATLRRAEEHCKEGEARLRAVLEHSSDIIVEYDADMTVRYASPSVKRILGYEIDEAIGKPALALVHPEDAPGSAAAFQRVLANPGLIERREHRLRHRNGDYLWFESVGGHLPEGPVIGGLVVNSREITDRVKAEHALRRSEEQFRLLFEHSPAGIALADPGGRYTLVNPAMCRMLGYESRELTGMSILDVSHPDDWGQIEERRQRFYRGEVSHFVVERRLLRKNDETIWARLAVAGILIEQGKIPHTIGVFEDITEERDRERLRLETLERQRDALVREVHHRVKNSLQGVVGLLELHGRERPGMEEPVRAAIARVNAVAAVHGLYAGAAGGGVRLSDVVDAIGTYQRSLFPQLELRIERPDDWSAERIDERESVGVALVINELALNAFKACARERCNAPVAIALARDGKAVTVTVSNGRGRLPESFDLAAARGLGTGLTLAKSLLPPQGARLAIRQLEPQGVEAELRLTQPVIILK